MNGRKIASVAVSITGIGLVALVAWAGAAFGASGGGFNPDQNNCPWNSDAWNTSPNSVPAGCHDAEVNVESGGTTNGNPNSNNVRFAEFGVDLSPNNPGNPSTGIEEQIGDPGTADAPHSGCLAANTDGTGGGTVSPASNSNTKGNGGVGNGNGNGNAKHSSGQAASNPGGCGNNPAGTGFETNWDYYAVYCPAVGLLPAALFPAPPSETIPDPTSFLPGGGFLSGFNTPSVYQCSADQSQAPPSPQIDAGSANALDVLMTQGLVVYVGAFDNLDNGEHDGFSGNNNTNGAINGASDGGGLILIFTPQWAQDPTGAGSATNPEGLVNVSEGECADSICSEITTQQQTVYYGCDATNPQNISANDQCTSTTPKSTNAYYNNTPASTQEVTNCSGGGPDSTETACNTNQDGTSNPNGANGYRSNTPQQVNAEPGIQTYQDPDPQRSPALPFGTPGAYVGTCGIYYNDSGGDGLPSMISVLTGGNVSSMNEGYIVGGSC